MVERKFRTWTSQAISLFRSRSSYPRREYEAEQTKIMSKNMVEKAEIMQKKKKKKNSQWKSREKKNALVYVKDRNIQWHLSCTTALEPSVPFHQHEEARERLYLFQVL